jgi:threonine dehydrogenase-like Zn-dependent dehydrogenase
MVLICIMDHKGTAAIIGLGAIGSILAYYGYTKIIGDEIPLKQEEMVTTEVGPTNIIVKSETVLATLKASTEANIKASTEANIKASTEVKKEYNKKKEWDEFWKDAYGEQSEKPKQEFPEE